MAQTSEVRAVVQGSGKEGFSPFATRVAVGVPNMITGLAPPPTHYPKVQPGSLLSPRGGFLRRRLLPYPPSFLEP